MILKAMTTGIVQVGGFVLAFLLQILVINRLGADTYGAYQYALTATTLVGLLGAAGLPLAAIRFMAPLDTEKRSQFWFFSHQRLLKMAPLVTLGMLIASYVGFHLEILPTDVAIATLVLSPAICCSSVFLFYTEVQKAVDQPVRAFFWAGLARPLLLIPVVFFAGARLTAGQLAFLTVLIICFSCVAQLFGLSKRLSGARQPQKIQQQAWLDSTRRYLVTSISLVAFGYVDFVILGIFAGAADIAAYGLAAALALSLSLPLHSVNAVSVPELSRLHAAGNYGEARRVGRRATHLMFWPTAVGALVLFAFWPTLHQLLGSIASDALPLAVVLVLGQLMNAFGGPVGPWLNVAGNEHASAVASMIAVATLAGASALAGWFGGPLGVALVSSSILALWKIGLNIFSQRRHGISFSLLAPRSSTR